MEQNKTLYETVFIVNNTLGEEAVKSLVEKFTGLIAENGAIESVNEWGVRRFASLHHMIYHQRESIMFSQTGHNRKPSS